MRADNLQQARNAGRVRGIIGLGIGVAGLAVGSVAGLMSLEITRREQPNCTDHHCDVTRADELSSANTLANISNVGFALGALGAVYGVYELLTLPSTLSTREGARLELGVSGVTLRGSL